MILSTATLTGVTAAPSLVEDIDFFLGTDSSSYPLAAKLRNINLAYYDVATVILAANSNWEWDDTNKTDFPIGTATMIAGQKDYTLPSDFVKIIRIEVKDAGGAWHKLEQFDETQIQGIGLTEFMESTGMPQYYREIGDSYELYQHHQPQLQHLFQGKSVFPTYSDSIYKRRCSSSQGFPHFSTEFCHQSRLRLRLFENSTNSCSSQRNV